MHRTISHHLRRFQRDPSGAVAIEFVLIAPLLLTLVFGIITLGYFIGVSHSVHQLASGAARASVLGLDQTERAELADAYLAKAGQYYPLLIQSAVVPQVVYDNAAQPGMTVNVSYDIDGSILDIANGLLGLELTTIEGSAYLAY